MNSIAEVAHAADALTSWISGVSTEIKNLASEVAALLDRNLAGKSKVSRAALTGLDELSQKFLKKNTFAVGAGTFFAAASVEEGGHAFEWWFRKESGDLGRLDFDMTPGSARYYDYEKLPYFSTAAATGEQTVWGPYIDYSGFEEYILTFMAPFSVHGHFTGVAGCDIRLTDLEPIIMPNLLLIPGDAALINASNRVVLGNSGMYLVGERIKSGSPDEHRITLDIPHFGLSLIYTDSRHTF
ncbi:GntR family transcriptional regulator [Mycobacterium sp. CBMA293]|uniref:cache domain-containing protein n=1 Tax=unclassified Mycolicibacterium TaxID=2636767 RepID=UPI0012DFC081|nr:MULTISPECIES: cache domain-containing protein [unclassified Mycolicibacterium]MUL50112.1 GntR family transcriptional regulator [Mycolicibacterium sp. CBMA 360]MUL62772.1 GntR family transcriptional regulator [Mycolicibacterium sp. CBMA 335]MUL69590.1 GntR family transcriptional regulator [Mycolicibacterium sp. CBMA 311]MUL94554.1 GntR family transcriptional regulator [Mycolicibacterium sp. CBMA 230]MUM07959.1 GntR family transcriptional regulator [Mycolicibacterium sp. CBMA 213]